MVWPASAVICVMAGVGLAVGSVLPEWRVITQESYRRPVATLLAAL